MFCSFVACCEFLEGWNLVAFVGRRRAARLRVVRSDILFCAWATPRLTNSYWNDNSFSESRLQHASPSPACFTLKPVDFVIALRPLATVILSLIYAAIIAELNEGNVWGMACMGESLQPGAVRSLHPACGKRDICIYLFLLHLKQCP